MINKSYKVWIILFIIINILLLVWSLGYFKFLEEKFAVQDNIIVIEPENQFKKSLAPKDQSFPNEKSKVWQAFEDKQNLPYTRELAFLNILFKNIYYTSVQFDLKELEKKLEKHLIPYSHIHTIML